MGNSVDELRWSREQGRALRERRHRRGLSQETLAEAAGLDPKTVRWIEQGRRQPRHSTLHAIAEALGCTCEELFQPEAFRADSRPRTILPWRRPTRASGPAAEPFVANGDPAPEAESTLALVNGTPISDTGRARRRWLFAGLVATAAVAVLLATVLVREEPAPELDPYLVAVAAFENATGDPALDHVGRHASDWIAQQISEFGIAEAPLTTPAVIVDRRAQRSEPARPPAPKALRALAETTGAAIVIWGAYYLAHGSIEIVCEIHDLEHDELVYAVPQVSGSRDEPEVVIETLGEALLGAVAAHYDFLVPSPRLAPPPNWAAYKELRATYWSPRSPEPGLRERVAHQIGHCQRAVELDRRFLWPHFRSFNLYFAVLQDAAAAETCLAALRRQRDVMTSYESLWHTAYECWFAREHQRALGLLRQLREVAPREQYVPLGIGVMATVVNQPHEAIAALESMDAETWRSDFGRTRFVWLCMAYHAAGDYEKELETVRLGLFPDLSDGLIGAAAALGRIDEVEVALDRELKGRRPDDPSDVRRMFERAVGELRWHGNEEAAAPIAARAVGYYQNRPPKESATESQRRDLAICLYLAERWAESRVIFENLVAEAPGNAHDRGRLGALAARRGDRDLALEIFDELHGAGRFDWCARIAALLGEHDRAVEMIREALAHGAWFDFMHADMDFESLRGHHSFEDLVRPQG